MLINCGKYYNFSKVLHFIFITKKFVKQLYDTANFGFLVDVYRSQTSITIKPLTKKNYLHVLRYKLSVGRLMRNSK